MINIKAIRGSVTDWASGFNFYKWGAILILIAAFGWGMNQHGKHGAELRCEEQKTSQAEARTKEVVKFVEVQVPAVNAQERESNKSRAKVAVAKEKYDEAVNTRNVVPACDLSDAEFVQFNELAKQTTR